MEGKYLHYRVEGENCMRACCNVPRMTGGCCMCMGHGCMHAHDRRLLHVHGTRMHAPRMTGSCWALLWIAGSCWACSRQCSCLPAGMHVQVLWCKDLVPAKGKIRVAAPFPFLAPRRR